MPQMLASADGEVDDARAAATKEINANVTAAQAIAGNDDIDAKAHDAHAAGYGQTVLPAGLSTFTEVDDEAASDDGILANDTAAYVTGIYAPTDPGSVQPDKDLPQPPGILASFLSDVSDFVDWLTSPFYSPIPTPPNFSGGSSITPSAEQLAELAVQTFCPGLSTIATLANAGYIPSTYMIGVQLDAGFALEGQGSADLAIRFTGGSPLDWEIGFIRSSGPGLRFMGGISESIVLSAVQNCNSLNELKGWAGAYDIGLSPAGGPFGGGVAVSNIGTEVGQGVFPISPVDNIAMRRPTVWSASGGVTFSPPNFVEPVTGGVVVTYTQVETITPREFLTTMTSWQNIQYAVKTWWEGGW